MKKLVCLILFVCAFAAGSLIAADLPIKSGDKLAFLGDSITSNGWGHQYGYLHLVIAALDSKGLKVTPIPAGVSGNKSNQMNARVDRDVIQKGATWMTLSCGVNDVWHGVRGIPLDQYKKEITELLDKVDKAGIKVMILTATMIGEKPESAENKQLADYNEFLRGLAKERNYLLADLSADMLKIVKDYQAKGGKGNVLTADGVHPAPAGDKMMARGILRTFGMTDAEIDAIDKDVWHKMPNTREFRLYLTEDQAELLQEAAKKDGAGNPSIFIQKVILEKLGK